MKKKVSSVWKAVNVSVHTCMDKPFSDTVSHIPILNSLLAMRISALGMMGGGRQNCSL